MSSEKKNFELDRRSLLKNILVGTSIGSSGLMNTFLTNMMVNFMQKGTAQAAGVDPAFEDFKFISFVMNGGYPRWYWDLPMNPNGSDIVIPNGMVVTRFNPDGSSFYSTTKVGNYQMPHIWNSRIPTTSGTVPMKDLAANMLTMRGIDMALDSHPLNMFRQIAPVPGGLSLSGLIADNANTPIPAVGRSGGGNYYKSEKGIPYLELTSGSPFDLAMTPFKPANSMISYNNGAVEQAIDQALLRMNASAMNKSKYLPSAYAARFNARKLMMKQFSNLQAEYTTLVSKYKDLITRSFGPTADLILSGVEDISIPGNRNSVKHRIDSYEHYSGSDILTTTDEKCSISGLAEGMAIAEFMVLNGLSSSVNVTTGNITNFYVEQAYDVNTKSVSMTKARVSFPGDAHWAGSDIALVTYTRFYRALSACIYELKERLKEKKTSTGNVFDKTVIAITSEFNRLPRRDGSGADHGIEGSNYTVFSGMIDELKMGGNIRQTNEAKLGTWGSAGSLPELGGRLAIIGNAASAVSSLLEIKTPTPNDAPFCTKEKGKAKMAITSLKNVA